MKCEGTDKSAPICELADTERLNCIRDDKAQWFCHRAHKTTVFCQRPHKTLLFCHQRYKNRELYGVACFVSWLTKVRTFVRLMTKRTGFVIENTILCSDVSELTNQGVFVSGLTVLPGFVSLLT